MAIRGVCVTAWVTTEVGNAWPRVWLELIRLCRKCSLFPRLPSRCVLAHRATGEQWACYQSRTPLDQLDKVSREDNMG